MVLRFGMFTCLLLMIGCAANEGVPSSREIEKIVRELIAERSRVAPNQIDMNKPLSAPPWNADDLDVVELIMDLEDRLQISISDDVIEKASSRKPGGWMNLTPSQLVRIIEMADGK